MIIFGIIIALAIVLGISFMLALAWRTVVPNNRVDIVQSRKKTTSYGHKTEIEDERGNKTVLDFKGNVYYKFPASLPLVGVSTIQLPVSNFDINLNGYSAYDKDRLPFAVDITGFFRIENPEIAARRISNFQELHSQLTEILRGTVRRVLAVNHLENIMEDRAGLGKLFTDEVRDQLKEWGVTTVKMIEFMDIRDAEGSKVIFNIMAKEKSRIERESRVTVADNMREAETKEIEAQRAVETSRIDAEQLVGIRDAEKDQTVGIAKEKSNQNIQEEAKVTAERQMAVVQVNSVRQAEINKQVAQVTAEQDKNVRIVSAEADRETLIVKAEGDKESKIRIAEGDLQATLNHAKGVEAEGAAKAEAERLLLQAPVDAQITLAKEIGSNDNYQKYLINIRGVEATEAIGKAMAAAMENADLKVIANGGDMQTGVANIMDMFGTKGGTSIAGMIEALSQTEGGKALVDKFTGTAPAAPAKTVKK